MPVWPDAVCCPTVDPLPAHLLLRPSYNLLRFPAGSHSESDYSFSCGTGRTLSDMDFADALSPMSQGGWLSGEADPGARLHRLATGFSAGNSCIWRACLVALSSRSAAPQTSHQHPAALPPCPLQSCTCRLRQPAPPPRPARPRACHGRRTRRAASRPAPGCALRGTSSSTNMARQLRRR